jgi:hypothetical protein
VIRRMRGKVQEKWLPVDFHWAFSTKWWVTVSVLKQKMNVMSRISFMRNENSYQFLRPHMTIL